MKFFGEPWAAVCEGAERVPTPVGVACLYCEIFVEDGDRGTYGWTVAADMRTALELPAHRECLVREVVGGIGHLMNHELWCVERRDPDAEMSYRESALAVWEYLRVHGWPK